MNKSNRRLIIIIIFLLLIIAGLITLYYSTGFDGKDEVELNVFDEFKSEMKATSLFRDVTNELVIENKPDMSKIGDYKVTYSYIFLGLKKKKDVTIHVVDKEFPNITLKGEEKVEIYMNDKYEEPGYDVTDNYDKEVKVVIEGEIDSTKVGNYFLVYKAIDSSNNKTEVVRKVTVSRVSPLAMNLKEYNLNDYFSSVILKETPTVDYMNDLVFAGDSVIWHFGTAGLYSSSRVWAKPCEGPFNFNTQKVVYKNAQSDYTLAEMIKNKKPKYLVLHMGVCDSNADDGETFAASYEKAIDYIKEVSPDTKLMIMSLVPQTKEYLSWIPRRNNAILNKYNYYLASLCEKKKVPFLNVAEVLKNSEGLANKDLYYGDGYHPNVAGMKKMIEYVKTHGYVELGE